MQISFMEINDLSLAMLSPVSAKQDFPRPPDIIDSGSMGVLSSEKVMITSNGVSDDMKDIAHPVKLVMCRLY